MPIFALPISSPALPLLAEAGSASSLGSFLPIILMFAVVYLIVLRPMSKQEKERRKRVDALAKGDEVVIGGGILGRISNADDPKIAVIEIADKVKIRVLKKDIVDTKAAALEPKPGEKKPEDKKAADKKAADKKAADKKAADKSTGETKADDKSGKASA